MEVGGRLSEVRGRPLMAPRPLLASRSGARAARAATGDGTRAAAASTGRRSDGRRAARTWAGQGVRAFVRGEAGASGVHGVGPGTGQAGPAAGERRARVCACAEAANGSAAIVLVQPAGIGGTRRRLGGGSAALGRRARAHACALWSRGPGCGSGAVRPRRRAGSACAGA